MSEQFVNKVYDRYLNQDFSYGQDNLNPVREISFAQEDETINELITGIKDKVDEISSRYPEVEEVEPGVMNTGSGFVGDPTCIRKAKLRAGGDLYLIPSFENEEDALLDEVRKLMMRVAIIAGEEDLNDINCDGSFDLITGEEIDTDKDKFKNDILDNDLAEQNAQNKLGDFSLTSGTGAGGNGSGSSSEKIDTSKKDKDEEDTRAQEKANETLEEQTNNNKQTQENVKECAKADLSLLKVIANILKVIGKIKKILNPTLNIVVEIVEIITLACQVWHNPPALAEIIQKVINKIIAILCMLISMILQMLWDLLGLDCVTEEAMDLLDQIRDALAGIGSIFAEIDSTAVSLRAGIQEGVDSVQLAIDAVDASIKSIPNWQNVKDYFDLKKMGQDIASDWKKNWKSYSEAAGAEILEKSGLREKVSDAVAKVEEVGDAWRSMAQKAAQMTGANSGIQRLFSSYENVKSL